MTPTLRHKLQDATAVMQGARVRRLLHRTLGGLTCKVMDLQVFADGLKWQQLEVRASWG